MTKLEAINHLRWFANPALNLSYNSTDGKAVCVVLDTLREQENLAAELGDIINSEIGLRPFIPKTAWPTYRAAKELFEAGKLHGITLISAIADVHSGLSAGNVDGQLELYQDEGDGKISEGISLYPGEDQYVARELAAILMAWHDADRKKSQP